MMDNNNALKSCWVYVSYWQEMKIKLSHGFTPLRFGNFVYMLCWWWKCVCRQLFSVMVDSLGHCLDFTNMGDTIFFWVRGGRSFCNGLRIFNSHQLLSTLYRLKAKLINCSYMYTYCMVVEVVAYTEIFEKVGRQ